MLLFSEKLMHVIGDQSVKSWAEYNGLPSQTVHEWVKHNRTPRGANLDLLVRATGIAKDWWKYGESLADIVVTTGEGKVYAIEAKTKANSLKLNEPEAMYIDSYPEVRGAAGTGQMTPTDQVIVKLAVNAADWRNYVGLDHRHVKVIAVHGDSMKPSLSHGDQVLVDTACNNFMDDNIYAIQQGELTRFKRIKLRLDGSIEVKSDNEKDGFKVEIYTADEASDFKVIGRVLPFKFGRFDL